MQSFRAMKGGRGVVTLAWQYTMHSTYNFSGGKCEGERMKRCARGDKGAGWGGRQASVNATRARTFAAVLVCPPSHSLISFAGRRSFAPGRVSSALRVCVYEKGLCVTFLAPFVLPSHLLFFFLGEIVLDVKVLSDLFWGLLSESRP